MVKFSVYLNRRVFVMQKPPSEDSNQTANVQDDLNLRRAHMSEGMFYEVAAQTMQKQKSGSLASSQRSLFFTEMENLIRLASESAFVIMKLSSPSQNLRFLCYANFPMHGYQTIFY